MINDLDYQKLDKEMDKTRTAVFMSKNAGFLGPLMCSLNFMWTEDIKTACTNGLSLHWNPHFFLKLPKETRVTVLLHEIWHVALLHMLRRGDREPREWNWACDIAINNMLTLQGYTWEGVHPWLDDNINRWKHPQWTPIGNYGDMVVEEIYEHLVQFPPFGSGQGGAAFVWGHEDPEDGEGDTGDIVEGEEVDENAVVNKVVQASTSAKVMGMGGEGTPSEVETMLKRFLQPKLPWEAILLEFFNELYGQDFSWATRDRRYQDVYLPGLVDDDGGLDHLMYFQDVSGSVSDAEIIRFNSEVKYIKDTFSPRLLTLVLFDDTIQREYVFEDDDPFDEVVIAGRGGTDLRPVREYILKHKPTAVVVFSDLACEPMEPYPSGVNIPTIWVGVNAYAGATVKFGKLIHIRE